ncbi:MAG: peptidylprolyl isomerase [Armatimonadetes bacterium]|nr:peptidylprolyl isomerase [Armatimonadota bacterium]
MSTIVLIPILAASLLLAVPGDPEEPQQTTPKEGDEVAVMETRLGRIVIMFLPEKAPKHVENIKTLAKKEFYDGTRFHRTIKGFMVQGGDPNTKDLDKSGSWGTGGNIDEDGKEINVDAEFNDVKHVRGVLSMARSTDPDSASSQFFIMHATASSLDGAYSAFGRVVSGMEVVDKIAELPAGPNGQVDADKAVVIKSVRIEKWPLKD